jgi:hypothetical protein
MSDAERRRYFRIEDQMAIAFSKLSADEAKERAKQLQMMEYESPNRLLVVERQLQLLIDKLRIQSPDFATAVDLLNTKFNLLKEMRGDTDVTSAPAVRRKVNISACGVSFENDEQLDIGQHLDMDITLLPTDLHVLTLGVVIGRHAAPDDQWTTRVEFYGMNSDDEELLVQHIVKRQGKLLAARRQRLGR